MGYSIRIGQTKGFFKNKRVDKMFSPQAPKFPYEYMENRQTNQHMISYHGWNEFLAAVGLQDLKLHEHGVHKLTPELRQTFNQALHNYLTGEPIRKPGYGNQRIYNVDLAILLWFDWWTRITIETCSRPAIEMA